MADFNSVACVIFPNDTQKRLVVVNVRVSMACVSCLGSLFVMFFIWLFKKQKFFTQRLILYLSIAAFLSSTAYIIGRTEFDPTSSANKYFCKAQGFWLLYTDWTVLMFALSITFNLFASSMFKNLRTLKLEIVYLGCSFLIPLFISVIPFIHDSFGLSGGWCWIKAENEKENCTNFEFGEILQFAVWYGPLFLGIALIFIMYTVVMIKIRVNTMSWQGIYDPGVERDRLRLKEEIKPLLWYPTVYFFSCLFPTISRIYFMITKTNSFPLTVLHVIFSPLVGFLMAVVYALDKETLYRLNWKSIRAAFLFRNTDSVVSEYPVMTASSEDLSESQPLLFGKGSVSTSLQERKL